VTGPRTPEVLLNPLGNRGVAFTAEQRTRLGLTGRLPSGVLTLDQQAARTYAQLVELPTDLQKNLFLEQLHDRNETLYYRVLTDHLKELLPIVYDPTVGEAIKKYSVEYRGPRGVYLSIDEPAAMEAALGSLGLGPDDVDLIVCTDAEEILGIGDWGVNGVQISVGKLAVYSAGGGIDPARTIAVSLDVGTDNEELLDDPSYLGNRHGRRRGADYDAFIDQYVRTASRLFPRALLHFEDFGPEHARAILAEYAGEYRMFNDDVQGTGAIVLAGATAALRETGLPWREQTLVVFGAGSAGVGIADQIHAAMVADGLTAEQAAARVWLVDRQGLLFDDLDDLRDFQQPYAKKRGDVPWAVTGGPTTLLDTIDGAKPTFLLGTSTVPGAFTREVVEAMCAATDRPLIFPISNPTERIEALPDQVIDWSRGRALVAVGIPVEPFTRAGVTYRIGQANNFLVYPGIGLGTIVSRARVVTPAMLRAAAEAVAAMVETGEPGAALLPDVSDIRVASAKVAEAVVRAAVRDGVATVEPADVTDAVHRAMWQVAYR
jgi:malate dehydrogenase (oxaloacetate-decarboxylating)